MRPGRYAYNVLPAYAHAISVDRPFEIIVNEEKSPGGMRQHNIPVGASRGLVTVEPTSLEIALGDLVLWNSANKNRGSFAIVGDQDFFDSTRMVNECGYSHAFGLPGEYRWRDVHGSNVS